MGALGGGSEINDTAAVGSPEREAALDRIEWRKMTKMVTRRRLIGWCGERLPRWSPGGA